MYSPQLQRAIEAFGKALYETVAAFGEWVAAEWRITKLAATTEEDGFTQGMLCAEEECAGVDVWAAVDLYNKSKNAEEMDNSTGVATNYTRDFDKGYQAYIVDWIQARGFSHREVMEMISDAD